MKENANKLSVIIPVYNGEKYLSAAVSSLRSQNWVGEMEIIIVDDGSNDETLHLAQTLGDIVLTQSHAGAAKARNAGLQASSGARILFLDADDILAPGAVSALRKPFEMNPALAVVFSKAQDFVSPELSEKQRNGLPCRKLPYGGILPGCALARREVFSRIGLFDESLKSGETVAWQMKLRDAKLPVQSIDAVTLKRRIHLTNTGRLDAKLEMRNYAAILRQRMRGK